MKKQKIVTLKRFFLFYRFAPFIFFAIELILCFSLGLASYLTKRLELAHITRVCFVIFSVVYLAVDFFAGKYLYQIGYGALTSITVQNRKKRRNGKTDVIAYPENVIDDFFSWNEEIKELNSTRKDIHFVPEKADYKNLNLNYLDADHTLVSHHDFHSRRCEFITLSASYRNALREVYYPFEQGDGLKEDEFDILLNQLKEGLKEFDDIFFSPVLEEQGIYVFFPHVDSLSYLKEKVRWRQRQLSLNRRNSNGQRTTLTARFAIVCYPYSDVDELFPDIHYAIRRQKPFVRYLPKRLSLDLGSSRMSSTRYRNITGKILSSISSLNVAEENPQKAKQSLAGIRSLILQSFSIQYGGRILLTKDDEYVQNLSACSKKEGKPFIKEGDKISPLFRKGIRKVCEEDNSYFASKRSQMSSSIAEYADRLGFSSCFFYCRYDEKRKLQGLIYFLNTDQERKLDSYLRESLLVFSSKICGFYLVYLNRNKRKERKRVNASRRKIAEYALLKIDKKEHIIKEDSENLFMISQNAKPGELCYKILFGLSEPCKDCPLITGTKKGTMIGNESYEESLTLNEEEAEEASILVKKKNRKNEAGFEDVFDRDLLINSFSTLVQSRTDIYKIFGKGYLIILRFDSLGDIVKAKGSEGTLLVLRTFLSGRKEGINGTRLYRFTPGSIGLLVPNCGQSDAISICESIEEWTSDYHKKNPSINLRITYLPISFPQGYPAASDFLSHARDRVSSVNSQSKSNTIYFEEGNYCRIASKKLFRLDVIKEKFVNNTFRVLLQPLLDSKNKQIFGAEMLLRLDDDFRNTQLDTAELIHVAYENNRIGLISNALLSYRGSLFGQFGTAFFKRMGVKRITLNTSSSFLKDEDLPGKRKERINSKHVPDHFFAFEIPEKDIYDDYLSRKPFAKTMADLGVVLVCDGFTGEYVSLERLKELGFSEIKIGRNLVGKIDSDRIKYTQVLSFLQDGKEYGLKVGLIGVENREQYRLIKETGYDCYRQGYTFYPPLEKDNFIKAVRRNNISVASLREKK